MQPPDSASDEARAVYLRLRAVFGGTRPRRSTARTRDTDDGASVPFGVGRDPHGLGDVMDSLTARMGWEAPLSQSELVAAWPRIVGEDTARHSAPVAVEEGTLTVQCDSTAWATQLRLMRANVLTAITEHHPAAGITGIRFEGPNAPSWKRGPRSIPGRGPRDTYG
jgi:predicted nucleic acid-binding Zn ribbon protein